MKQLLYQFTPIMSHVSLFFLHLNYLLIFFVSRICKTIAAFLYKKITSALTRHYELKLVLFITCSILFSTSLWASTKKSKFEQRCEGYIEVYNEMKCNSFIDKSLRKGKLLPGDSCIAFYYKCKLYLNYHNWNSRNQYRFKKKYPNADDQRISIPDTLIKYSRLLFQVSDSKSTIYKRFLTQFYYYICAETMRNWDPETFVDSYYYQRNPEYCHDQLYRISVLKELVSDFPQINQFGFELYETNLKCQFGLINEEELDSVYINIQNYTENRVELEQIAEHSSAFINEKLFGFQIIKQELSSLLEYLLTNNNHQGRSIHAASHSD